MPGRNCAFFGCATSQKHGLSLFKIPSLRDDDSEHTVALKTKAREEWLRLILRTREKTPALKKRIEANNIFVCELHFKPDCILTSKFMFILARRILINIRFINNTKALYMNIYELNVVFSHNI